VIKARKGNELPRPVTALALVFGGKQVPKEAQAVFDIIWLALISCPHSGRIDLFNHELGQLKRQNSEILNELSSWLLDDKTKAALLKAGYPNLQRCWLDAIEHIKQGRAATAAFRSRGRPHSWQFSKYDQNIFKTERLRRGGMRLNKAIEQIFGPNLADDREVRRRRQTLRVRTIPDEFLVD